MFIYRHVCVCFNLFGMVRFVISFFWFDQRWRNPTNNVRIGLWIKAENFSIVVGFELVTSPRYNSLVCVFVILFCACCVILILCFSFIS